MKNWILLCLVVVTTPSFGDEDPYVGPIADLFRQPTSEYAAVVERWSADRADLNRMYPVGFSPARRARLKRFTEAWRERLKEAEFDGLTVEAKADYLLLDSELRGDLARLERDAKQTEETSEYLPFAPTALALIEARGRLEPVDGMVAAESLAKIQSVVEAARKTLGARETDKIPRTIVNRALRNLRELRQVLGRWFAHYDGYDPSFSWWCRDPFKKADQGLDGYEKLLTEKLGPKEEDAIRNEPVGREAILDDLKAEMIPYSPEELIAIGEREYAWCEAEMKKAAAEMGFGDDWKAALEKVKRAHLRPGEQPMLVRDLAREAMAFLDKNELVTVPALAREDWRLEMMSPQAQKVNPFFLGGESIIVAFPTDAMELSDKVMSLKSNNVHFARATVHHELIPGHHLQYFMNARANPHRQPFGTPFWTEGWALYWEMLLWDKGFPKSPEDRVGMLFWRMHRCARIEFSLKFHLGKLTPQECIDLLVNKVGHERFSATGEVRRSFAGNYSPLYQAAYMLGGLQLRALHKDLVDSGKLTDRQFHNRILWSGGMPIEMVRVLLATPEVKRDFTPSWRFAGDPLPKPEDR